MDCLLNQNLLNLSERKKNYIKIMKIVKAFCFVIWMIISFMLVCSVIGLVLFVVKDRWEHLPSTPSTWMTIGIKLIDSIIE